MISFRTIISDFFKRFFSQKIYPGVFLYPPKNYLSIRIVIYVLIDRSIEIPSEISELALRISLEFLPEILPEISPECF